VQVFSSITKGGPVGDQAVRLDDEVVVVGLAGDDVDGWNLATVV